MKKLTLILGLITLFTSCKTTKNTDCDAYGKLQKKEIKKDQVI